MSRSLLGTLLARSLAIPPLILTLGMETSAAGPPQGLAMKADPRLLRALGAVPDDSITTWVEFADKGESGPADLARRLAAAELALSPRARARRIRARVQPLVDDRDLPVEPRYLDALRARGFAPYAVSRWLNQAAIRAEARRVAELAELPFVTRLVPVDRVRRSADPEAALPAPASTPRAARLAAIDYGLTSDALAQIGIPALHDSGYAGAGVLVCVLDEGFNYYDLHEALRDQPIPPERTRDFFRGGSSVQDTLDPTQVHGTWVLGLLAGKKLGRYVGAAYDAEYMLGRTEVRAFERRVEMVYWASGVEWADSSGADVISTSLGYTTFDNSDSSYTYADMDGHTTIITRAAEIAASKGILVVAAVGNDGDDAWHFLSAPSDANGDSVIAAGAVDASGAPAAFSSYGPSADGRIKPDLAARGVSVPTANTSGIVGGYADYSSRSGTSFSTPLIAGAAACLLGARPQATPREVIRALRASASRKSTPDVRVGYGIPNAAVALGFVTEIAPAPRLALALGGPNPVSFSRGPARFTLGVPLALCGASASVVVRDLMGRRIRRLWSGVVSCAPFPLAWDGLDDDGRAAPAGLYLVDARIGRERATLRLVGLR